MKSFLILATILIAYCCNDGSTQSPQSVLKPNRMPGGKTIHLQLKTGGRVFAGDHEWKGNIDSTLREAIRIFKLDNNDTITVAMKVDSSVAFGFVHRLMKVAQDEKAKVTAIVKQY